MKLLVWLTAIATLSACSSSSDNLDDQVCTTTVDETFVLTTGDATADVRLCVSEEACATWTADERGAQSAAQPTWHTELDGTTFDVVYSEGSPAMLQVSYELGMVAREVSVSSSDAAGTWSSAVVGDYAASEVCH